MQIEVGAYRTKLTGKREKAHRPTDRHTEMGTFKEVSTGIRKLMFAHAYVQKRELVLEGKKGFCFR